MGLRKRAHVLEKAREWKNSQEGKQWRGHFSENLVKSLKVITKLHLIWEAGHDGVLLSNEGEKSLKPQRESKSGTLSLSLSLRHIQGLSHMLFSSLPFSLYSSSYFAYSFTYTFAETKISRKPLSGLKLVCVIDSHGLSGAPRMVSPWDQTLMTSLMSLSLSPAPCLFLEGIRCVKQTCVTNNSI